MAGLYDIDADKRNIQAWLDMAKGIKNGVGSAWNWMGDNVPSPSVTMHAMANNQALPQQAMVAGDAASYGPPQSAAMPPPPDLSEAPMASQPTINSLDLNPTGSGQKTGVSMKTSGSGGIDPEILKMLADLHTKGLASIDQQRGGVEDLQNQLQNYATTMKPQLDLSPLLALADSWNGPGSNLSKGYNKPTSPEDRVAQLMQLQQGVQKARSGLSENDINLLKDEMGARVKLADLSSRKEELQLKREENNIAKTANQDFKDTKLTQDSMNAFSKDYQSKFAQSNIMANAIADLKQRIKENGGRPPINDAKFNSDVGLLIPAYNQAYAGLGALAGHDVGYLESGTGVTNDLGTQVSKLLTGKEDNGATMQILDKLDQNLTKTYDDAKKIVHTRFAGRVDPLMDEHYVAYQAARRLGQKQGSSSAGGLSADQIHSMSDDEVRAAYRAQQKTVGH